MSTPAISDFHPSGEQYEIAHGERRAVVVEVGGGVRTMSHGELDVLDGYGPGEMCSAGRGQILIPWPNRIRDGVYGFAGRRHQLALTEPPQHHAIHGLVRWANWTCRHHDADRLVMAHSLRPQAGYPYALDLELDYRLDDNGLSVTATARNAGTEPCPYGAGAHPYLTVGTETIDPCCLTIPAATWLVTDERQIPIGRSNVQDTDKDFRDARPIGDVELDTGFCDLIRDADGRARVILEHPGGSARVALWLDEAYPFVMAFTGDALPDAGRRRRGIGIEPMTCAPNAYQSGDGLIVLEPGQSTACSWGIETEVRGG